MPWAFGGPIRRSYVYACRFLAACAAVHALDGYSVLLAPLSGRKLVSRRRNCNYIQEMLYIDSFLGCFSL